MGPRPNKEFAPAKTQINPQPRRPRAARDNSQTITTLRSENTALKKANTALKKANADLGEDNQLLTNDIVEVSESTMVRMTEDRKTIKTLEERNQLLTEEIVGVNDMVKRLQDELVLSRVTREEGATTVIAREVGEVPVVVAQPATSSRKAQGTQARIMVENSADAADAVNAAKAAMAVRGARVASANSANSANAPEMADTHGATRDLTESILTDIPVEMRRAAAAKEVGNISAAKAIYQILRSRLERPLHHLSLSESERRDLGSELIKISEEIESLKAQDLLHI